MTKTQVPAIEGWFTTDPERPALLGTRCTGCGTYAFPRASAFCANPACPSTTFDEVELSRTGTVWSFTNSCYEPPPPYISPTGEFEPYTLAAVEPLTRASPSCSVSWPATRPSTTSRCRHAGRAGHRHALRGRRARVPRVEVEGGRLMGAHDVAVLGVGMHPWGKWGRNCRVWGGAAANDALADAGLAWSDIEYVAGVTRSVTATLAYRRRHVQPGAGLAGQPGGPCYAASRPGAQALNIARFRFSPGSATWRSSSAPTRRPRASSPPSAATAPTTWTGCASGLLGATNPTYFALYARRR
ncbi:MAG: zinc ribbon domain-containing protein [Acidimicrobiales bacterium]